jgi:sortase A
MDEKSILKASALISAVSGFVILFAVIYPIASYESYAKQKYPTLISPLTDRLPSPRLADADYTKASNWFVGGAEKTEFLTTDSKVSHYTLSIPKLGIENAVVAFGGEDLSKNLIQYPGTAVPGKSGNTVIFGHSILPIFYNPKDYLAIFSTINTLKKGDIVRINYDGISYTYRVETMFEVLPTDLQVLEQNFNDSYLSLITCSPPGHPDKPKRLVVRARIVDPSTISFQQKNVDIGN